MDPVHYYPGTSIRMQPGDILYSKKLAFTSFLVGHTAIIGENYRVYHVNQWGDISHADSMPIYMSRHKKGERLTILRHGDSQEARNAARWAHDNRKQVTRYIYKRQLDQFDENYCSKFVWQAYYYGNLGDVNLSKRKPSTAKRTYIFPREIYTSLEPVGVFSYEAWMKS